MSTREGIYNIYEMSVVHYNILSTDCYWSSLPLYRGIAWGQDIVILYPFINFLVVETLSLEFLFVEVQKKGFVFYRTVITKFLLIHYYCLFLRGTLFCANLNVVGKPCLSHLIDPCTYVFLFNRSKCSTLVQNYQKRHDGNVNVSFLTVSTQLHHQDPFQPCLLFCLCNDQIPIYTLL